MVGAVWSIRWGNPYTEPPPGSPRVLAEEFYPVGHRFCRVCPPHLEQLHVPGNKCVIQWAWVSHAPRKRSQDEVALDRQRRMRRRMQKKYPLFAEWAIQQEMAKRPAYYAGETDAAREQAKVALETQQRQRLVRLVTEYEEREKSASTDLV